MVAQVRGSAVEAEDGAGMRVGTHGPQDFPKVLHEEAAVDDLLVRLDVHCALE